MQTVAVERVLASFARVLALMVFGSAACSAHAYSFITLDPPGATWSRADGINAHGQVVGYYADSSPAGVLRGFLWDATAGFTTLEPPGATGSQASAINGHGQVVGNYTDANGDYRAFQWDRSSGFTDIVPPGSTGKATAVTGINDNGQVVGWFAQAVGNAYAGYLRDSSGYYTIFSLPGTNGTRLQGVNASGQAFGGYSMADQGSYPLAFASDGNFEFYAVPGSLGTEPTGINNRGTIVGFFLEEWGYQRCFIRTSAGKFTVLLRPIRFDQWLCWGINDRNDVVGTYARNNTEHGFVRDRHGHVTTLDAPGAQSTKPFGINGHGHVFGAFVDWTTWHAFVAVP